MAAAGLLVVAEDMERAAEHWELMGRLRGPGGGRSILTEPVCSVGECLNQRIIFLVAYLTGWRSM